MAQAPGNGGGPYQGYGGTSPAATKPYDDPPRDPPPEVYRGGHATPSYGAFGAGSPDAADGQHLLAASTTSGVYRSTFSDSDDEGEKFLNDFLKTEFDDIIREREGTQSIEQCRRVNNVTYTYTKNIWYKALTLVSGILLSVWWGFWFATYAYFINWWWHPMIRLFKMTIYMWAIVYRAMCRAFMHPFYEAISITFSNIRVRFTAKTPYQVPGIVSA